MNDTQENQYENSCILYSIKRGFQGKVTIGGTLWYLDIVSTGQESPSYRMYLAKPKTNEAVMTVLFTNDETRKSKVSGSIVLYESYWIDIYQNESKTPGGEPYFILKFKKKEPRTEDYEQTPPKEPIIQNDLI